MDSYLYLNFDFTRLNFRQFNEVFITVFLSHINKLKNYETYFCVEILYASRNTVSPAGMFLLLLSVTKRIYSRKYVYLIIRLKVKINFKTKRNLLYIRSQCVPRSKHFPPWL